MNFFMDCIRGAFIGIANIIPGVSGGTMAVSLGIYDKMISALTGIFKDWKKSVRVLLPIIIGAGIGIVALVYLIQMLLEKFPLPTCLTFIGLILGGLPMLAGELKKDMRQTGTKLGIVHILLFAVMFAFVIVLPLLGSDGTGVTLTNVGIGKMVVLFFIGVIASATMVIPGVSGSMVLMILGYYSSILDAITDFLSALSAMDINGLLHGCAILVPFGLGVLIGIFVIAKIIEFLFQRFSSYTYSAILGLILASPFAIFINMGKMEISVIGVVIGVILLTGGGIVTYKLGASSSKEG